MKRGGHLTFLGFGLPPPPARKTMLRGDLGVYSASNENVIFFFSDPLCHA